MNDERKYFLDWLRVGAFACLILFHAGLLYVSWNYSIKSERLYPGLEFVMMAVSPWRMPLLFFIAGVASHFLLRKLGPGSFALDRVRRLFVVLVFGILVINPTQAYVELLDKGLVDGGYLDFWLRVYLPGALFEYRLPDGSLGYRSLPNWDHLWFLPYLLVYSLVLALLYSVVNIHRRLNISVALLIVVPALWLGVASVLIEQFSPVTQTFVNDWANHLRWIGMFVSGVLCAGSANVWTRLQEARHKLLAASLVGLGLQIGNALLYRAGALDPVWDGIVFGLIQGIYGWPAVLTLAAYAARYLNVKTPALGYLTDAMLPVYVIHQPILLASAYVLFPMALPVALEAVLLVLVTAAGSLMFYELLVRRWRVARVLFGLKAASAKPALALRYE